MRETEETGILAGHRVHTSTMANIRAKIDEGRATIEELPTMLRKMYEEDDESWAWTAPILLDSSQRWRIR
jgi:hypothetical protein